MSGHLAGAQGKAAQIDSLFRRLARAGQFNGTILVAEQGRVLYERSFGYADLRQRTPNTPASRFQTASISKTFTSTAVLQLLEQGQLKLSDPLAKYLPAFPYPAITLRHLLTHTSGLPGLELYEAPVRRDPGLIVTNALTIPALRRWERGLYFEPGTAYNYCNTNFTLLAQVVEQVSGLAFPEYLRRHVFRPAGMRDTYVRQPQSPADPRLVTTHLLPTLYAQVPERAETVRLQDSVRQWKLRFEQVNVAGTVGDGNVVSTPRDLLRFDQALYGGRLLQPATVALAATPARLPDGRSVSGGAVEVDYGGPTSYGLGWVVREDPAVGRIVGHDGYTGGIATMLYRNVTRRQTIIAYDNTVGEQFREKIAAVVAILNGQAPRPIQIKQSAARGYGVALLRDGPESALVQLNAMRADTLRYRVSEREINVLGYEFLFNGYPVQSLETFRLNALLFPASFNVYDSYGDALRAAGRRREAILMYQQALVRNPRSEGSRQALRQLLGPAE